MARRPCSASARRTHRTACFKRTTPTTTSASPRASTSPTSKPSSRESATSRRSRSATSTTTRRCRTPTRSSWTAPRRPWTRGWTSWKAPSRSSPRRRRRRAIAEWGRPASDITHLVVATYSGSHMPGADHRLASLLGLRPSVRRTMLYMNGCASGSAALRVAKDVAENERGARVLVACAELTLVMLRAPSEAHVGTLVMQSMFGDGAAAAVVGADQTAAETPVFEMVSASQTVIPETEQEHLAAGRLREDGLLFDPSREMPALVRDNIERCVADALGPLGVSGGGWNDLFWAVHPGGRAVLDSVEAGLRLEPGKLAASRRVLSEFGNLSGPAVIFVLDELQRRQEKCPMGVMLGLGPGVSVETMVLRSTGSHKRN